MGNLVGPRLGQMVRRNFVVESHLPLIAQISYIHQKPTAKAWNWYQRWLWRNGTRISVWNNPSGNTGLPFQMFCCFWKLSTGMTQKVVFNYFPTGFFRNICKWSTTVFSGYKYCCFWCLFSSLLIVLHKPFMLHTVKCFHVLINCLMMTSRISFLTPSLNG